MYVLLVIRIILIVQPNIDLIFGESTSSATPTNNVYTKNVRGIEGIDLLGGGLSTNNTNNTNTNTNNNSSNMPSDLFGTGESISMPSSSIANTSNTHNANTNIDITSSMPNDLFGFWRI